MIHSGSDGRSRTRRSMIIRISGRVRRILVNSCSRSAKRRAMIQYCFFSLSSTSDQAPRASEYTVHSGSRSRDRRSITARTSGRGWRILLNSGSRSAKRRSTIQHCFCSLSSENDQAPRASEYKVHSGSRSWTRRSTITRTSGTGWRTLLNSGSRLAKRRSTIQ